MRTIKAFAGLVLAIGSLASAHAQEAEYPSAVASFARVCLVPGLNPADRLAALAGDAAWKEDAAPSVDLAKMSVSRAIDKNYSFAKPQSVRQWSGQIDGKPARFVLATFDAKSRYPNLCALVLEGVRNALPYSDETKTAFKAWGIGGKSVDLVHYFEFAGKVGPDKHPARGEIFTRSLAGQTKETAHLYLAY
ncbi:hypothetical protein [Sphingomonas sp. KR3-1]|uniref:hypothetical protein n=1 Tax=Sphingomonas sp. KR3-1 TaxID=3156611 RepID=UPI0032B605EB